MEYVQIEKLTETNARVSFIFCLKEKEFHCIWRREISRDNSRKGLMDCVAEDLTEGEKATAG